MHPEIKKLKTELDALHAKLIAKPDAPDEVWFVYNELLDAIVVAGNKADAEAKAEVAKATEAISAEIAARKDRLTGWLGDLKPIVATIAAIVGTTNPAIGLLAALLR